MPLIYLSLAWVVGVFLGAHFHPHFFIGLVALLPLVVLLFRRQSRKPVILTSLCLVALFGGMFRLHSASGTGLQACNGNTVQLKGVVAYEPEAREKVTHLRLKTTQIKASSEWQEASSTILLFVFGYPAYDYGDELLVTGKLKTPPQFEGFDYSGYLAQQGIYSVMRYPQIEVLSRGHGSGLLAGIYSLRNRLALVLAQVLPEPQASLAQGIILGIRSNIPRWLNDAFARTGTTHLLAISGVNLTIVAGILISLGLWLWGRRHYIYVWLALATVWFYTLLTGMNPPVLRSAIMVSLFLIAELLGRQRNALTALCFAATVMVAISPRVLWDASFQLSFLAMTGLVLLVPRLQNWSRQAVKSRLGETGALATVVNSVGDSFMVTLGAMIFVAPLIAYYFGIVSLVGPVATLLAMPALPAIIITGGLTGLLGLVTLPVAQVVGWLAWLCLSYFLLVVRAFAAVPLAAISSSISVGWLGAYYAVLVLVVYAAGHRNRVNVITPRAIGYLKAGAQRLSALPVKWVIPPLLALAILTSIAAVTMPDGDLHVSFLDVGQGDAILVQSGHQNILIDGGPSPQALGMALGQRMPFWDRTIDLLVLTHPHADHLSGLVAVLQRYEVSQVLYPALDDKSPLYDEFLRLIREKSVRYTPAQAGQRISLGREAVIDVLHPAGTFLTGTDSDLDNNSLVLRLSTGKVSFLLTADIQRGADAELISRRGLTSTVFKVPHHGSSSSTSAELLAVASPRLAVISVGKDNRFGHPGREVLERLEQRVGSQSIYRTDKNGTIEFTTDGERLWAKTEK